MNISFIGYGRIAKAIAQGLLSNGKHQIKAAAPSLIAGHNEAGIITHCDNLAVLKGADVIILAVKPTQMSHVFAEIKSHLPNHCLIISVASGITLDWFRRNNKTALAIVRAMPNLAAAVGKSATPLIANQEVAQEQKNLAEDIFSGIGQITWLENEADLDTLTALSGSGPAYIFFFMEAMVKAATALGLEENLAKNFVLDTVDGAHKLAALSPQSLAKLRQQVTSPGGTTAAALDVFYQNEFENTVAKAIRAARDKARELSRAVEKDA